MEYPWPFIYQLTSSLGFPHSKEVMWSTCRHDKCAELVITRESGVEKKVIELQSKREANEENYSGFFKEEFSQFV